MLPKKRTLEKISVAGTREWRYRDRDSGIVYTAAEARLLTGPTEIIDCTKAAK